MDCTVMATPGPSALGAPPCMASLALSWSSAHACSVRVTFVRVTVIDRREDGVKEKEEKPRKEDRNGRSRDPRRRDRGEGIGPGREGHGGRAVGARRGESKGRKGRKQTKQRKERKESS